MTSHHEIPEHVKQLGDVISIGTVVGTFAGYLPAVAALLTIIWTAIRIYESHTVQRWLGKEPVERRGRE